MRRLLLFCAAAAWLAGCAAGDAAIQDPPAALDGGAWVRGPVQRPGVDTAPAAIQPFRPKQWLRTEYARGGSIVKLDLFLLPGEAVAFEARQKWLGESRTVSMNHRDLFLVAASETETPQALAQFLRLMEAEWLAARPR